MSNAAVGNVYEKIILEVINNSRVDFEDAGVDERTLTELRDKWQTRLSSMRVASLPWEPQTDPPEPSVKSGAIPSRVSAPAPKKEPEPKIKAEPVDDTPAPLPPPPPQPMVLDPMMAKQRALQNLEQLKTEAGASNPMMTAAQSAQQHIRPYPQNQRPQANGLPQHDGGDSEPEEEDEEALRKLEFSKLTCKQVDRLLAPRLKRAALPTVDSLLWESDTFSKNKSEPVRKKKRTAVSVDLNTPSLPCSFATSMGTLDVDDKDAIFVDGPDDMSSDPVPDDEAINSDLDDPEEDLDDDEDEDGQVGQIMLCLYDKVTRTKNKWKCVLKDGVLTINGREYVFHKATGEYEW